VSHSGKRTFGMSGRGQAAQARALVTSDMKRRGQQDYDRRQVPRGGVQADRHRNFRNDGRGR